MILDLDAMFVSGQLQEAVYKARDGEAVWVTERGQRIAAIVSVKFAEYAEHMIAIADWMTSGQQRPQPGILCPDGKLRPCPPPP